MPRWLQQYFRYFISLRQRKTHISFAQYRMRRTPMKRETCMNELILYIVMLSFKVSFSQQTHWHCKVIPLSLCVCLYLSSWRWTLVIIDYIFLKFRHKVQTFHHIDLNSSKINKSKLQFLNTVQILLYYYEFISNKVH